MQNRNIYWWMVRRLQEKTKTKMILLMIIDGEPSSDIVVDR